MAEAPLSYVSSAGDTNLQITSTLPTEVVQCLQNARFLHLATCTTNLFPHVSLMNYTYLPSSPFSATPIIIMTTNPASKKTHNLISNPHVSLLVHDWVSHRPPTTSTRRMSAASESSSSSPPPSEAHSSLAAMLLNLNSSALSSISATINGDARLVAQDTPEERFYRAAHLENNTFDESASSSIGGSLFNAAPREDGGRGMFIEGEEVRVVVVKIRDGRVADWKGDVRDWSLRGIMRAEAEEERRGQAALVNGV